MRWQSSGIGFLIASLLLIPASLAAQDLESGLRFYQRNTRTVLDNAADMVRPVLTSQERQIQSNVRISVPREHAMIAQAHSDRIVISAGFTWVLEQLAAAYIADAELGYTGCEEEYTVYLANRIAQNSSRMNEGLPIQPVAAPHIYGRKYGGNCGGFNANEITLSGNGDYNAGMIEASLVFLYLHELAHHVLGHVRTTPRNLEFSRRMEADADAWAVRTAFAADYNVLAGVPIINLLGAIGGSSLEHELKVTHPLGIRRVRDMLKIGIDIASRRGDTDTRTWIEDNLRRVERNMPQ